MRYIFCLKPKDNNLYNHIHCDTSVYCVLVLPLIFEQNLYFYLKINHKE